MRGRSNRTAEKGRKFLDALAEGASVTRACRAVKISRRAAYDWRAADEAFAKAWDAAADLGTDALEDEAVRRGHEGVKRPVFYKGKRVAFVQEYSDTLLIFMLKARRPKRFRDNMAVEHDAGPSLLDLVMGVEKRREADRLWDGQPHIAPVVPDPGLVPADARSSPNEFGR